MNRFHPYSSTPDSVAIHRLQSGLEPETPALQVPTIRYQFVVHHVGSTKYSQLILKLLSNNRVQTVTQGQTFEQHGSWNLVDQDTLHINWHWKGLSLVKKQTFTRVNSTQRWERSDPCEVEWMSILMPCHPVAPSLNSESIET